VTHKPIYSTNASPRTDHAAPARSLQQRPGSIVLSIAEAGVHIAQTQFFDVGLSNRVRCQIRYDWNARIQAANIQRDKEAPPSSGDQSPFLLQIMSPGIKLRRRYIDGAAPCVTEAPSTLDPTNDDPRSSHHRFHAADAQIPELHLRISHPRLRHVVERRHKHVS